MDSRVCSWLWVFDVFHTLVVWTHGGFTALSRPILLILIILLYTRYVICIAVIHGGWVDRFVGVTVVLRPAVLL